MERFKSRRSGSICLIKKLYLISSSGAVPLCRTGMLRHGVMIGRHDEVVMVVVVVLVTLVSVMQLALLLAGACREQLLAGL